MRELRVKHLTTRTSFQVNICAFFWTGFPLRAEPGGSEAAEMKKLRFCSGPGWIKDQRIRSWTFWRSMREAGGAEEQ